MQQAIDIRTIIHRAEELKRNKEFAAAFTLYSEAHSLSRTDVSVILSLAECCKHLQRYIEQVHYLQEALRLGTVSKLLRFELALALMESGQLEEAENLLHEMIAKSPKDANSHNLLGVVLKRASHLAKAIEHFKLARKYDPRNISPYVNLGNSYLEMEDGKAAAEAFSHAVRMEPKNPEHQRLLGRAYLRQGDFSTALKTLEKALFINSRYSKIYIDLAAVYMLMRDNTKALEMSDKGLALNPSDVALIIHKAMILRRSGQIEIALSLLENAMRQHPESVDIHIEVANALERTDREKANHFYKRATELAPKKIAILGDYCESLNRSRYGDEGAHIQEAYRIAKQIVALGKPSFSIANTLRTVFQRVGDFEILERIGNKKQIMEYWVRTHNISPLHYQLSQVKTLEERLEMVEYHRSWGKTVDAAFAPKRVAYTPRTPNGKIRIGFMSSDLRNHPVCYFAWPILEEYDRSKFEIYCYSFSTKPADGAQTKIETMVDCFRLKPNISDEDAALMIAADSLDILFELGGTTDMNKLEVMALRPAPIQVSWVGYPHSSGLETIDYILTDPYITPKDPRLLIEKPFELKESWVALGRLGFHDVEILPGLPEDRDGFFTFGTASNPYKFTPDLLVTWAAIMREVPDSRFLFIRPEGGTLAFRENMVAHFAKHGIAPERIMFEAVRGKHMQHYNRVDIALDTFPHVGGTTTCETLWMGVPTVSVAGPAFFERMSYSNLSNAGLGDLCGHSVEEYIQIALKLAADKPRRAHLRQHLRQEMKTRPLGDTTRFVRNFEAKVTEVVKGNVL